MVRDADSPVDRMNFMVDFDGEGLSGFDFTVTMAGDITDSVINNENQFNTDWDGDWQYAVHEDEAGYSIEWLIPWSIAPMKNSDAEKRTIGVFFSRVIADTGERWAYPNAIWTRPRFLSDFHRVEITQYKDALFTFTPYAVARRDIANADSDYKTGVDLFWKPNGDHQFAGDDQSGFRPGESDQLVVNFDAIETFFSDKRRSSPRTSRISRSTVPVRPCSIHDASVVRPDDGSGAADINAAVKANGSFGDLGYGVFAASEDGDAGRDFLLARGTHVSENLTLGLTQTHVDRPFLDRTAGVTSIDARWQPNAEWSVQSAVLHSEIDMAGVTERGNGAA